MPYGVGYPFGSVGQLAWFCPLPDSGAPQYLTGSMEHVAEKSNHPWLCAALLSIN